MRRSDGHEMRIIAGTKQVTACEIELEKTDDPVARFRAGFNLHISREMLAMWIKMTPSEYRLKMASSQ